LGAIAIAVELGISENSIVRALQNFQGIARRCNVMGQIAINGEQLMVVDDYAHHPSEIRATLNAIRTGWPEMEVLVVFQPHRYTRTRDLFADFCQVLSEVDSLIFLNVYPAGEKPIAGADSRALSNKIKTRDGRPALLVEDRSKLLSVLPDRIIGKQIVLIMGAGDIGSLGSELLNLYGKTIPQE
jgi:UDP-N-acetylmuramate--alanine ligase